jgi:putative SOS response-associated peptidase YedK
VIRRNHQTGETSLDPLRWGLIPYWCLYPKGGRKPINAKCETADRLPMFREANRRRRWVLPVDGFYEWKAIKGEKAKPYAIAMKDGWPFGHWRPLGKLERPDLRRVGSHVRSYHYGCQ